MSKAPLPSGIAVDLGGTKISAARVNNGVVGEIVKAETDPHAPTDIQIQAICDLVRGCGARPGAQEIGVAVAGRVNAEGEWYSVNSEILTQIDKVPLRQLLSQELYQDVTIENDATAAAIGEMACGASKEFDSFAYVTVSTGVGGGIIVDRKPVISRTGLAGHVGFTTSRMSGRQCGSGRSNTVESIASGRALAAAAAALGHTGLSGKEVYEAHLSGTDWASKLVSSSAAAIAELGCNLKAVLDIDALVIGGGVGLADGYADLVSAHLHQEPELFRPLVRRAVLAENSALIGVLVR